MEHWLWIILAALFFGLTAGDTISPERDEVRGTEGQSVTLTCKYESSDSNPYLYWYKHQSDLHAPQFILYKGARSGSYEHIPDKIKYGSETSSTSTELTINKLTLEDTALYYCAVKPGTYGNSKLVFGSGTKLMIESSDESQPSFYKLGDSDPQVCLATDFSKHNVNSDRRVFSETEAVLMDNLYSQVAVLPKGLEEECDEGSGGSGPCEDKLEQDPMVNLMSMTVLGLRLLFLKTIVFNVLMTFRLWISQ